MSAGQGGAGGPGAGGASSSGAGGTSASGAGSGGTTTTGAGGDQATGEHSGCSCDAAAENVSFTGILALLALVFAPRSHRPERARRRR